jgi:hypothetical protein
MLTLSKDENAPAVYWSVLECDIAIVCACMPALRIILGSIFPKYFGSKFNSITGESRRTTRNEQQSTPKSDPEADPITKTVASWTVNPDDHSRTPSPVEMNNIGPEENKH